MGRDEHKTPLRAIAKYRPSIECVYTQRVYKRGLMYVACTHTHVPMCICNTSIRRTTLPHHTHTHTTCVYTHTHAFPRRLPCCSCVHMPSTAVQSVEGGVVCGVRCAALSAPPTRRIAHPAWHVYKTYLTQWVVRVNIMFHSFTTTFAAAQREHAHQKPIIPIWRPWACTRPARSTASVRNAMIIRARQERLCVRLGCVFFSPYFRWSICERAACTNGRIYNRCARANEIGARARALCTYATRGFYGNSYEPPRPALRTQTLRRE